MSEVFGKVKQYSLGHLSDENDGTETGTKIQKRQPCSRASGDVQRKGMNRLTGHWETQTTISYPRSHKSAALRPNVRMSIKHIRALKQTHRPAGLA